MIDLEQMTSVGVSDDQRAALRGHNVVHDHFGRFVHHWSNSPSQMYGSSLDVPQKFHGGSTEVARRFHGSSMELLLE